MTPQRKQSTFRSICQAVFLASLYFAALGTANSASSAEAIKSGLQPGDRAGAFYVQDVTGPRKGSSLCYACAFGKRTVINLQVRELTPELAKLLKKIDSLVTSAADLDSESKHAFLVYLTDDPEAAEDQLTAFAEKHGIHNTPLTVFDDLNGPAHYKLSSEAAVTVMMWADQKVRYNHAFSAAKLSDVDESRVVDDARKHLQ